MLADGGGGGGSIVAADESASALAGNTDATGPTGAASTLEDGATSSAAELEALPYRELQQYCKAARLPATGKKAVLVQRLLGLV